MDKINSWIFETLGSWTLEYFGLWLIVAAGLALILIITLIAVAICHAKNKKKIKALKAENAEKPKAAEQDEAELREKIRAEVIAEQGENAEKMEEARHAADLLSTRVDDQRRKIDELEDSNKEKQNRINELSAMLEQANSSAGSVNRDLYRQINELNQTVRDQENEINLLKAENAQIKAQALQQQLAATTTEAKPARAAKSAAATKSSASAKSAPAKSAPAAETTAVAEPAADDDDEYDEYYDDYGDENSAIKVTLKFDRNKNNWIVLRSDTDRTYRRLATKQEALVIAKDLARRLHAQLVVHRKDGKFQKI